MAKVLGFGGVFVKAEHPEELSKWYGEVLGFPLQSWGGAMFEPLDRGCAVWSAFAADTDHFDPSPHAVMINLIVDDLDGVLARAAKAGVEPIGRVDGDENGAFAWIMDPAGVKLELWQPKA